MYEIKSLGVFENNIIDQIYIDQMYYDTINKALCIPIAFDDVLNKDTQEHIKKKIKLQHGSDCFRILVSTIFINMDFGSMTILPILNICYDDTKANSPVEKMDFKIILDDDNEAKEFLNQTFLAYCRKFKVS